MYLSNSVNLLVTTGLSFLAAKRERLESIRGEWKLLFRDFALKFHTVNPNPVQLTSFPCKSIPTGKNLLSLQGNPVLIAGSLF